MTASSAAGFALVFVLCTWALSALGGVALQGMRPRLARLGPAAERRAAILVAGVPVALGAIATVALVAQSALGVDHCAAHAGHAHLCVAHGDAWLAHPWVVVTLVTAGATIAARALLVGARFVRGARGVRGLHAVSRDGGEVRIVDSARAFGFVAGAVQPTIYVSSRAWTALTASERAAVVAHETAHVRHGDLWKRVVLEAALVVAAPLVGDRVRATWLHASERLCDAHAVAATGEPAAVASAMVALCRLQATRAAAQLGFTPTAADLAGRVHAVLAGGPLGERAAAVLGRVALGAAVAVGAVASVAAGPLHHAFETLLG